jgi:putative transposase
MLAVLEWLYNQIMEVEISTRIGTEEHERTDSHNKCHDGFRPRRFDTRMSTIYLIVPKPHKRGYIPLFMTE